MAKPTKKRAKQEPLPLCAGLLKAIRGEYDPEAVRAMIGTATVSSLPELAKQVGVASTTLRSNWSQQGMPGGRGRWPLADIVLWRLKHQAAISKKPVERSESSKRLENAEVTKAELGVEKLELDLEERRGRLIDRQMAGEAVRKVLSSLSESIATLGEQFEPQLPIGSTIPAEINAAAQRALVAAAEQSAREVAKFGEIEGQEA